MENEEDTGIKGILCRLEKERNLTFGLGPREKEINGSVSWRSGEHHQEHAGEFLFWNVFIYGCFCLSCGGFPVLAKFLDGLIIHAPECFQQFVKL